MDAKEAAARRAVTYVQNGMTIGLGTGSTAQYAIQAIGERVSREGLQVRGVPTSVGSREMATGWNIPLIDSTDVLKLDLTIDGADEVDPTLNLIKGAGGALLREKLVAVESRELIIICDESKLTPCLGARPLPVAVVPFAFEATQKRLMRFGGEVVLRMSGDGEGPLRTDDGLYVLDLHLRHIDDPAALERSIKSEVGVVEVGLFVGLTTRVVIGRSDGSTYELPC